MELEDLDSWRIYFKSSGFNIFVIIENAIMVAAKDNASHLRLRREHIVCLLYHHCCPCNHRELSAPLEERNVSQPNADRNITYGRNCFEGNVLRDKNQRVDNVDFNLSVEQDKSLMVECNEEKQTDKSTGKEDVSNKNKVVIGDAGMKDVVKHQDQVSLRVPAEDSAVKQNGNSNLGCDGVSDRNECSFLESLDKNKINYPQDGLNKNTIVEGVSDSENVASNGISNDKDNALLEDLSKFNANQSGGSKEVVGDANFDGVDLQDGLNKNTIVEGSSDSKNVASNGISNDKDNALLEDLSKFNANQSGGSKEVVGDANFDGVDLQDGLNKNTIVEGSSGSKNVASNGISNDKDNALLKNLSKFNANRSGGSKEVVGDANFDGVDLQDQILLQVPAEHIAVKQNCDSKLGSDGFSDKNERSFLESLDTNKINYLQDGLNKNTTVEGSSDSNNVASNGISNDKDSSSLENLSKLNANKSGGTKEVGFDGTLDDNRRDLREGLLKNTARSRHCGFDGGPNLLQMCGSEYEQITVGEDLINLGDDTIKEVLEIKKLLEDWKDQPDTRVLELLMKLKRMDMDFNILKVTLIGKAVNALRKNTFHKHGMKKIHEAASSLIGYWKTKVDEWMDVDSAVEEDHSSAKDQCPSGLLFEGITVEPLAPTLDETVQAFDGLNEEEFFSLLPEDILGNFYTNGELGFTEEEQLQIDTVPGNFGSSVSIREEDLQQQTLPLQETCNFVADKQPVTDKSELAISDDSKQVEKKGYTTMLGNQFPIQRMPEINGNRKRKHNEEDVVMKLNVASKSQLKSKGSPEARNVVKPEHGTQKPSYSKRPENLRISRSNEPREVEGTRRKLGERYRKVEDVKKQHDLHGNHDRQSRDYKRHKHHHHAQTKKRTYRESSRSKHSNQKSGGQQHPPSSSSRR